MSDELNALRAEVEALEKSRAHWEEMYRICKGMLQEVAKRSPSSVSNWSNTWEVSCFSIGDFAKLALQTMEKVEAKK